MDIWFYFDVTHALHEFCNPIRASRVDELGAVLDLRPGMRLLDIASGHGEFLIRWSEKYDISGVGVDLSEYALARAERRRTSRIPDADVRFVHEDGAKYQPDEPFDVVLLVGASWIWNGYAGTLEALRKLTAPGGLIVFGEPFWKQKPSDEYLAVDEDITADMFTTLAGLREHALGTGLELVWMMESSLEDWDRYEMLQAAAVDRFGRENPDHPDLDEIRKRRAHADEVYLKWGRDSCGFAIWVFRVPAREALNR